MSKVAILGNAGMLGHMVEAVLKQESGIKVNGFGRESFSVFPRKLNDLGARLSSLMGFDTDYIINCIGAIKPTFDKASSPAEPIYINAVFPHQLATWGELTQTKIIHITTDCVFAGYDGQYIENDEHDAVDLYGRSKSIGEPPNAMVIRTSIIGPEIGGRSRSLLEWIKSQEGKTINGYSNHLWNGLTTLELANCLTDIISGDVWTQGIYHVFSEDITKHDMLHGIIHAYGLDIDVNEYKPDQAIDRTLRTIEALNAYLQPACFSNMIGELVDFERRFNGKT